MRSRLRAIVVATVVVGLTALGVGTVVAKSPQERAEIRAADRMAQEFDTALERHVGAAASAVKSRHDADQDGYRALLKVVESRLDEAPALRQAGTTSYGRSHSDAYRTSAEKRELALRPLITLRTLLMDSAIPRSRLIAVGKKLVRLRPGALLGDTPVSTGQPLRDLVLPAFEKVRKRVKDQDARGGTELLLLDLTTYADDMVAMTKDGAKKIDAGEPFFFELGDRPVELLRRLTALEAATQALVAERVDIVVATL